jgi:hypothetical protein
MSLFANINTAASKLGLRFLVIGAHAVIEHGFQRGTEDADVLVCKDDRARWLEAAADLGYRLRHDGDTFLQFEPQVPLQWNLDLMLVPAATFERLLAAAKPAQLEGAAVLVPSLEHLLALKIHALKHGKGLRVLKDTTDIVQLLTANRIDPRSSWLQSLFDKHGTPEIYERIVKLIS